MILKQRFEAGRTQFIDIGDNFLLIQRSSEDFKIVKDRHFHELSELGKEVHAFIQYGDRKEEPLYFGFAQWIHSNDGQLFMTLTVPLIEEEPEQRPEGYDEWYKKNNDLSNQTLAEARAINDTIPQ